MPRGRCCVNLIPCSHGEGRVLWGTARLPLGKVIAVSDGDLVDQGPVLTWNSPASHSVGVQSTVSGSRQLHLEVDRAHSSYMSWSHLHTYIHIIAKLCLTLATPWTVSYQAPLSMGFSGQEYWNGLPFPSPGDLPDPAIEPGSPALQADSLRLYWLSYEGSPWSHLLNPFKPVSSTGQKDNRDFKLKNFLWSLS